MDATLDGPGWLSSWDRQQELYMPDREERFAAMLEVVTAVAGDRSRVLDLACGPGSVSHRLLRRLPAAEIVAVDVDPALLAIARATLADRVRLARADIADPAWTGALEGPLEFDAVVTATALHWLPEGVLRRVYRDLAGVIRPGGVFLNADHMPSRSPYPATLNRLAQAVRTARHEERDRLMARGTPDWELWWREAARDPVLAELVAERNKIFAPRRGDHGSTGEAAHSAEFTPPADWHLAALEAAGFAEAAVVWRSFDDAVVAGLR